MSRGTAFAKKLLSCALSAALIALAPGLAPYEALAGTVKTGLPALPGAGLGKTGAGIAPVRLPDVNVSIPAIGTLGTGVSIGAPRIELPGTAASAGSPKAAFGEVEPGSLGPSPVEPGATAPEAARNASESPESAEPGAKQALETAAAESVELARDADAPASELSARADFASGAGKLAPAALGVSGPASWSGRLLLSRPARTGVLARQAKTAAAGTLAFAGIAAAAHVTGQPGVVAAAGAALAAVSAVASAAHGLLARRAASAIRAFTVGAKEKAGEFVIPWVDGPAFKETRERPLVDETGALIPELADAPAPVKKALAGGFWQPSYLAGEAAGAVRASWTGVKDFFALAREMALGNPKLGFVTKPHRKLFFLVAGLLVVDALMNFSMATLVAPLLDAAAELAGLAPHKASWISETIGAPGVSYLTGLGLSAGAATIGLYSTLLLGSFALYLFVENRHVKLARVAGLRLVRDLRSALLRAYLRLEMAFHLQKENKAGSLANRLLNDNNQVSNMLFDDRVTLPHYLIATGLGLTLMLGANVPLALVVLGGVVILAFTNQVLGGRFEDLSWRGVDLEAALTAEGKENFQQVKNIKGAGALEERAARYARKAADLKRLSDEEARLLAKYSLGAGLADFFTKSLVFIVGAVLIISGKLSYGEVMTFMLAAGIASYGFNGVFSKMLSFRRHKKGGEVVTSHFLREPAIKDAENPVVLEKVDGTVEFEDVGFTYPDGKGKLENVSFRAEPGQMIAFVGTKGSGKSTIMRMLSRTWEAQTGAIRVNADGVNLREVELDGFLRKSAFVPQSTTLFDSTIRYNMTYGSENVTEEQLRTAIERADAGFVYNKSDFPKGFDTPVTEGGKRLSGGQLQRIHLVRAILKNPALIVLDEATSALNGTTEAAVLRGLDSLRTIDGNKPTRLVIAHRLPTIRGADVIHVLDAGRIVESGTHAELLRKNGRYAQLWRDGEYDVEGEALADKEAEPAAAAAAAEEPAAPSEETAADRPASEQAAAAPARAPKISPRSHFLAAAAGLAAAVALGPLSLTGGLALIAAAGHGLFGVRLRALARGPPGAKPLMRVQAVLEQRTFIGRTLALPVFLKDEARALRLAARRAGRLIKAFVVGDDVVRPFVARRLLLILSGGLAAEAVLSVFGGTLIGKLMAVAMTPALAGGAGSVLPLAVGVAVLAALGLVVHYYNAKHTGLMNSRLIYDLRTAYHQATLRRELAYFRSEDNNSTDLSVRNTNVLKSLAEKNASGRLPLLKNLLMFVLAAVMLAWLQPLFAVVVIASVPLQAVVNGVYGRKSEANYEEFAKKREALGRGTAEKLDLIEQIKTGGTVELEARNGARDAKALADNGEEGAHLIANAHTFSSSLRDLFTKYMIFIVGSAFVAFKFFGMDAAQITEASFYAGFIALALDGFTQGWLKFSQMHGETRQARRELSEPPSIADAPDAYALPEVQGGLTIENLRFSYAADQRPALDGFSLDVKPGETIGFVADSGAGKSTLFDVLKRYYEQQDGSIKIDGVHETRKVTLESLSRGMAFVPQDRTLFNDTIRANMLFGTQGVSEERLMSAIRAAGADWALERGLDQALEKGGADLSGGQQQSVLFVRALLSDAKILLLDEATSAFDKASERHIKRELEARKGKQTILMIAHNLQTMTTADRIVVMKDGRVDDVGTHAELLRRNEIYSRNWKESQRAASDQPLP